ncbi:hypothetical protein FSP39_008313 [Pinctada imbricata]|uniref:Uncharacterized protein n=1 Tax=Pinctada imbricata TaxID=66713 RepID=A0AA89BWI6_PINIB|nr:hypothetical protein FSP39_008313 [Pinctada imbricata]
MWSDGDYQLGESLEPSRFTFYLQMLNTVSTLFGMYGLIVIFRNTANRLTDYRVRVKFVSLQLAFVLLNLQSLIILTLARYDIPACKGVRGSIVRGYRTHYFLLILEFFLLSVLARFGYRRFEEPRKLDANTSIEVNHESVRVDTDSYPKYNSTGNLIQESTIQ